MRILRLKNGREIQVSNIDFAKIKRFIDSGANKIITIKDEKFNLWDVADFSPEIDDVMADGFLKRIDENTKYIKENTKPKLLLNGRKITKDEWLKIQNDKLDKYISPPDPADYPPTVIKIEGETHVVDHYKRIEKLWKSITQEKRKQYIESARKLLEKFYPMSEGAGHAYVYAIMQANKLKTNKLY